ncbi:MAG: TNT domain-containing protein [Faecalibacterium sp.]|nr:TNT domain-containing protein [Ruminococcus sp.]MCM1391356.1 TNT domain-containing protein [Ruminococcus sp.]MCM1484915.1 TNT domain-containing protein [Faecalibacterium sp.]
MSESSDSGSSSFSSGFDSGSESSSESFDAAENAEAELFSNESEEELYNPEYDYSEYETELMDFSYEAHNPDSYDLEQTEPLTNDKGEPVEDVPLYRDGDYLDYENPDYIENGTHHAKWPENDGFEGEAQDVELPANTVLSRYGSEHGHYATDKGADPSKISTPYDTDTQEYHEYIVAKPVECRSGKIAPAFDETGGETQYAFSKSFAEMVKDGTLTKVK